MTSGSTVVKEIYMYIMFCIEKEKERGCDVMSGSTMVQENIICIMIYLCTERGCDVISGLTVANEVPLFAHTTSLPEK